MKTKSARLSMKTNTTTLLGAVLFLLVICAAAPHAQAQEGTLIVWGYNDNGQVSGAPAGTFSSAAGGLFHCVAIRTDGTLVSWANPFDPLVYATPAGTFSSVAAGWTHSIAMRTDGSLVSWGADSWGLTSGTPGGTFSSIAAGQYHSVAIRTDGSLASWGYDGYGQVSGTPAGTFSCVASGATHCVAIRTDGTLASWGNNASGQVSGTPGGTFSSVAAGERYSVAIRTNGTLVAWGHNGDGLVSGAPAGTFSSVAAGSRHCVAIRTNGTLASWGDNNHFKVSATPAGTFSFVGSGASSANTLAIRTLVVNQAPVATGDFYGMDLGGSLTVSAPGILTNDSDPDEDALTVELVTGPAHASSFQLNAVGSFSYTPYVYFSGEDTFTYRVSDGTATSEIATVHVTVSQPGSQGFITGGGKFFQDGRKCTFGFVAKVQGNGVQGNLEFQDHDMSLDVKAASMAWVYAPNQVDGSFSGTCRVNGVGGYTFFVQVHDRGQPGSNDDFAIWVFDPFNNAVYSAGALLSGGNIVIHGN